MTKTKHFIKYLGLDDKWHKIQVGKNAKVIYTLDHDQETNQTITLITKGSQTFKAKVYTFIKEQVKDEQ